MLPTWYDSFAFSILEAMACGVPVITTELAGASELIEGGTHGQVLPGEAEPEAIAGAVVAWLVAERLDSARTGLRARAESFGFERTLAQIEGVLIQAAKVREQRANK